MKKLYERIEDIHIKGGIEQLTEVVTAMDISLQSIADNTENLTDQLIKYSASNKGAQYERVVKTAMSLRDALSVASYDLNDMQNQVVAYQNKVYRYEDMNVRAQKPNPYIVSKNRHVSVDTSEVEFRKNEMMAVAALLKKYSELVIHHVKIINEKKNSIGAVWRDSQYKTFSEFIDITRRKIGDAMRVFDEYYVYLEGKLKEVE